MRPTDRWFSEVASNAYLTTLHATAYPGSVDPLLTELLKALRHADTSSLALSLCDEIVAKANRAALRELISNRLHQLVPVATEPTAALICGLLGLTLEQVSIGGRSRWRQPAAMGGPPEAHFSSPTDAYQAAVLERFPRKEWEAKVDRGVVRTRYWAWALVQALETLREPS
ncbi:MAG: hypothetical protein WBL16_10650 [Zwartia sp.]